TTWDYSSADALGSVIRTFDVMGNIVATTSYDSFGNATGATPSPFGFTGRDWDVETGLYYHRARYYDPKIGRFISEDPIGFLGEDVNLYGYVWNNPVNWLDPSGLKGRRPTARNVAIKTLRDLMKDPDTQRNEQCFSVCERAGQDPFTTPPKYGT